jgi:Beta-lactamase superfamily domain
LQRHTSIPAHRIVQLEWWESAKLARMPGNTNFDSDSDADAYEHQHDWRCVQIHSLHKRSHGNSEQEHGSSSSSPSSHHHPARLDPADTNQLWITATPVQHWASRTMFDRNYRLWAGFCVFLDQQQTFFFPGDTAFPQEFPLFEQVADYIASAKITTNDNDDQDDDNDDSKTIVDLAALPIGAYKPRFLNHASHMEPKDALRVHEILQCRQSVAIHHGTFCLSEEPPDEPPQLLQEAIAEALGAATQEQHQQLGMTRNVNAAAAALNFVAIPHGGRVNLEPISAPPIVGDSYDDGYDGRNIVVEGDSDSAKDGEEDDDDDDDDDDRSRASASG